MGIASRPLAAGAILTVFVASGLAAAQVQRRPDFTSRVDVVTTDVVVRDSTGQFIADLKTEDFEVLEDGVPQKLISFSLTHGGRTYNILAPAARGPEGLVLPASRPAVSDSGRIFFILVDDLHLDFRNTGRLHEVFARLSEELVQDGDMFGIVSTGTSSIAIPMTYDRRRLAEAAKKLAGGALTPGEIIDTPQGSQGPAEVRHRAHVAFATAADALRQLGDVHDRRKAFVPPDGSRPRAATRRLRLPPAARAWTRRPIG